MNSFLTAKNHGPILSVLVVPNHNVFPLLAPILFAESIPRKLGVCSDNWGYQLQLYHASGTQLLFGELK